jgi:hypothetical protein
MVFLPGSMVANTMANGSKVNSMARDSILIKKVRSSVVNGKMEKELYGLKSEQL